jgi:hypothetical protein
VVVTIKPTELLSGAIAASGTIDGQLLHLTGGGNMNLNLLRSNKSEFRAKVTLLTARGSEIVDTKARRDAEQRQAEFIQRQVSFLEGLSNRMSAFDTKASGNLPKFVPVEERYRFITGRMNDALTRERSIYGGFQAGVARSQISVAINQAAIEANSLHISVQSSYQRFNFVSGQLLHDSNTATQDCRRAHAASADNPVSVALDAHSAACLRFLDVVKQFQEREAALRAAFVHAETIWTEERQQQDAIVQASQTTAR